jgi:uncharacterized UBP type Zn finger protein
LNALVAALRSVNPILDVILKAREGPVGVWGAVDALSEVCTKSLESSETIDPHALLDVLRRGDPLFRRALQQDAHEALMCLLKLLNDDGCDLSSLTTGTFLNTLTCENSACLNVLEVPESVTVWSLPVGESRETLLHLVDVHRDFTERVEYKCTACGHCHATSRRQFLKHPQVLITHLKRFSTAGGKIMNPVVITPVLDVGDTRYRLSSLVSHQGHEVGSGHYVCDFIYNGTMYTQDDAMVTSTHVLPALGVRDRTGYLAFYVRQYK